VDFDELANRLAFYREEEEQALHGKQKKGCSGNCAKKGKRQEAKGKKREARGERQEARGKRSK
jgi:hypothetical protein